MENSVIESGRLIYNKGNLIGARSFVGALADIGAANAVIAAIRNIGPEELNVDSIEQGFVTLANATALTGIAFAVYKVTGFTVLPATGGRTTAPNPPLPVRKRTSDNPPLLPAVDPAIVQTIQTTFASVQIAQTAALTGGTFTAPEFNDPIAQFIPQLSITGTTYMAFGLVKHKPNDGIPWALAPNEGLIFVNQIAWPAGLTGRYSIGVDVRNA